LFTVSDQMHTLPMMMLQCTTSWAAFGGIDQPVAAVTVLFLDSRFNSGKPVNIRCLSKQGILLSLLNQSV
jgi:hypothetical protein